MTNAERGQRVREAHQKAEQELLRAALNRPARRIETISEMCKRGHRMAEEQMIREALNQPARRIDQRSEIMEHNPA